jgi:dTDP-4-amino-4,6-dideoxygalactose transaminase
MSHLQKLGIETKIHYPNLITEQQAYITKYRNNLSFKNAQYQKDRILSLPIHEFMKKDEILYVAETINNFFRNESNNE